MVAVAMTLVLCTFAVVDGWTTNTERQEELFEKIITEVKAKLTAADQNGPLNDDHWENAYDSVAGNDFYKPREKHTVVFGFDNDDSVVPVAAMPSRLVPMPDEFYEFDDCNDSIVQLNEDQVDCLIQIFEPFLLIRRVGHAVFLKNTIMSYVDAVDQEDGEWMSCLNESGVERMLHIRWFCFHQAEIDPEYFYTCAYIFPKTAERMSPRRMWTSIGVEKAPETPTNGFYASYMFKKE